MIKKYFIPTFFALSLMADAALAEVDPPSASPVDKTNFSQNIYPQQGFYFGVGGGYGDVNESVDEAESTTTDGLAWTVNGGYQITKNFAAELGYNSYPNQDYEFYAENISVKGSKNYAYYGALKAILPFAQAFGAYTKLGIASVHNTMTGPVNDAGNNSAVVGYIALGLQMQFTQHFGAYVEYNTTAEKDPVPAMMMTTLGFSLYF